MVSLFFYLIVPLRHYLPVILNLFQDLPLWMLESIISDWQALRAKTELYVTNEAKRRTIKFSMT